MKNKFKFFTVLAAVVLLGYPGLLQAEEMAHDHGEMHKHAPVKNVAIPDGLTVQDGEVVIVVHGIVCSFCSRGVRRNISRLSFVDHSKYTEGVKVEIESQKVTVALKPGAKADFKQIFASIKSGGYEPVKAYAYDGKTYTPEGI